MYYFTVPVGQKSRYLLSGSSASLQLSNLLGLWSHLKFDWGKSPFQVHMVVDRIQAPQARRLRASVSCQLLTQVCSQFLDGFRPEAIHSSLTHGPPPHGLLLHQTH